MIGALAWRLSLPSGLTMSGARYATAPASTTAWASSGECLAMSARADAPMRFSDSSGSCTSNPHVQRRKASVGDFGEGDSRSFRAARRFPSTDCGPYRGLHVRRERLGFALALCYFLLLCP
jgi:hypothetical protein